MCLQGAVEEHFKKPGRKSPLYFISAPVPRALWPDKPNLSRGTEFTVLYCKLSVTPGVPHDSSITLLGEPLVEAGMLGLITAQTVIAVLFIGLTSVLVIGVMILSVLRSPLTTMGSSATLGHRIIWMKERIMFKLAYRQASTGMCLQGAVEEHFKKPGRKSPLYFISAPVPRALWPDKPNLSRGTEFTVLYCKLSVTPGVPHDSSITLLGEPLVEAGMLGLITAQTVIAVLFIGLTLFSLKAGPLGLTTLAALTPWLIDFDQNFALYIGNLFKMSLFMLPIFGVALVTLWRPGNARA